MWKRCSGVIDMSSIVYCMLSSSFLAEHVSFISSVALLLIFSMSIVLLLVVGQFTEGAGRGSSADVDSLLLGGG